MKLSAMFLLVLTLGPTSATAKALAPVLEVTPHTLDLSLGIGTLPVRLINVGDEHLYWSASTDESWLLVYPAYGSIPPTPGINSQTVWVEIDREKAPSTEQVAHVFFMSNGGDKLVEATFHPPLVTGGGTIGLYSDAEGTNCNILDSAPGLLSVYVVHSNILEGTASEFSAPMPSCMTGAMWLGDSSPFPVKIGNSQIGVSIGYGACLTGPIHVLTIVFTTSGSSEGCCEYPVLPDPWAESGTIQAVDCWSNWLTGVGAMTAIVNPTANCTCGAVRAQSATWGRVKAVYSSSGSD